ncbi:hypothetical protein VNO78_25739 [Psophocarpus tetragonolobus]|uniref:Uncharacterized protein n=1 Tax=Psophocarpus tetragonolobus TaxID=3891 RepID=A0AAN9XG25_PSOTE
MYEIPTSSLNNGSSQAYANIHHHMNLALNNNNRMEALHDQYKGKVIWNFSKKAILQPSEASLSKSPSPFSLNNEYRQGMMECYWDTDKKVNGENIKGATDNIIKGPWTLEEDSALVELVNQFGLKKWSQIAKLLHGRMGKQYVWTIEEDKILIEAHQEVGNRWSQIAKRLPGRTENGIKNRWNCTKRRQSWEMQNNSKYTTRERSMLHAYIKKATLRAKLHSRTPKSHDTPTCRYMKPTVTQEVDSGDAVEEQGAMD